MLADFGRDRETCFVGGPYGENRISGEQSRTNKKVPADVAEALDKENLAGLIERQLCAFGAAAAVDIVVEVPAHACGRDAIAVFFQVDLRRDGESAATVVGDQSGGGDHGGRRNFILGT